MENKTPLGTLALAAMHELDRQRGVDPFQVERASVLPQPTRVEQSLRIEKPDWDLEARERLALEQEQERQERARVVAEELARLEAVEPPAKPTAPAPKQKPWRRGPA